MMNVTVDADLAARLDFDEANYYVEDARVEIDYDLMPDGSVQVRAQASLEAESYEEAQTIEAFLMDAGMTADQAQALLNQSL